MARPVCFARFDQQLQAFDAHALERVGRGARLVGAAAQHGRAGLLDRVGDLQQLAAALDAARPGHHRQLLAADRGRANIDDGVLAPELAAGQLVGRQDGDRLFDAVHHLERGRLQRPLVADDADDGALGALAQMRLKAQLVDAAGDMFDFGS